MALLTRELELVIIARDATQATTARVAGAIALIGGAVTMMGVAWGRELGQMTQEAIDFRQSASLAFTQMFDQGTASIEEMEQMFFRVGRTVPVQLAEIGEAAFDVFSSIEATIPEAERILMGVGRAAVAGQTDMRSAMIPTIAMMNAFNLGVEDMDFILDQQFLTVQRGILTYGEYTGTIGRVIPAAVSAGQSIETMGAAMAFLTRNGLSAEMASASASRAFELFASPKARQGLEDLGVAVVDSKGQFRDIGDVIEDLGKKFDGMTKPERKEAFKEIFGQGTIQARRFFDLAIPNWQQFQDLVDTFSGPGSVGAMERAYKVMAETPQAQLQQLTNRWQILRAEIGQNYIPMILSKLVPLADRLLDFWEALDPEQKGMAAKILAVGAAVTTLLGVFTTALGIGKLLAAVFGVKGFLGVVGAIGGPLLKFLGPLGLLVSAGILVYKNWNKIVEIFNSKVIPAFKSLVAFIRPFAEDIVKTATDNWNQFVDFIGEMADKIRKAFDKFISPELQKKFADLPEQLSELWEKAKDVVGPAVEAIKEVIKRAFAIIEGIIKGVVAVITWIWKNFGDEIVSVAKFVWDLIVTIVGGALDYIKGVFQFWAAVFKGDWDAAGQAIMSIWATVWETIKGTFGPIFASIGDFFAMIGGWIASVWNTMWTAVKDFFVGIWNEITGFFTSTGETVSGFWTSLWGGIASFFEDIWNGIAEFFRGIWENDIVQLVVEVIRIIGELVRIGWEFVFGVTKTVMGAVWSLIQSGWNTVKDFVMAVWGAIKTGASLVWNAIKTVIGETITAAYNVVSTWVRNISNFVSTVFNSVKTFVSAVWNTIKQSIEVPIAAAYGAVSKWVQNIKTFVISVFNNAIAFVRSAWEAIKRAIIDPIAAAYYGVVDWISGIIGYLGGLVDKARSYAETIRKWLSKINPASWFSPPLTYQTAQGFKEMARIMADQLTNMEKTARSSVSIIRGELGGLHSEGLGPVNGLFAAREPTGAQQSVQIDVDARGQGAQAIADEISWRLRMS